MIAYLSGKLLEKNANTVIVDVGGVGYEIWIPLSTFYELGDVGSDVSLRIYTHVREDAIQLFGFKTSRERELYLRLISVQGEIDGEIGTGNRQSTGRAASLSVRDFDFGALRLRFKTQCHRGRRGFEKIRTRCAGPRKTAKSDNESTPHNVPQATHITNRPNIRGATCVRNRQLGAGSCACISLAALVAYMQREKCLKPVPRRYVVNGARLR